MSSARLALVTAALVAALVPSGCAKKTPPPAVTVVEDTPQDGAAPGAPVEADPAAPRGKKPAGKPIHVTLNLRELGDVMTLVKQATTAWTPKQPIDPATQAQAILLQLGYGPGLWTSLDLAGAHALDATFHPQDTSYDLKLAGSVAALSPKGILDAMPSSQRPQPLGNGLWELVQGDLRIIVREQPKSLEFALSQAELARAAGLAAAAGQGRRLQLRGEDLPKGMLESSDLLSMLPAGLRRQVAGVLREATAAAIELDAGTDRDLALQLSAAGPFAKLGLSPLGPARAQPTALEAALPPGPALVVSMPWGSPETLHALLDKGVRVDQIPAPFDKVARDAIAGSHALLDQVAGDVVFAVYLSPAGEVTALIAAGVKDEAAARAAVRGVEQAAVAGLESFNTLTGEDKSAKIGVKFKADGARVGGLKGDQLTVDVPKNMDKEAAALEPVLGRKKQLQAISLVSGQVAFMAIGAGAQKLAGEVAAGLKAPRKTSLSTDGGLRQARQASQGCHFCVGLDPTAVVRLGLLMDPERRKDKARLKEIDAASAAYAKVGGALGLGVRLEPETGAFALGMSKSLLVPPPAEAAQLSKLFGGAEPPAAPDKPLAESASL